MVRDLAVLEAFIKQNFHDINVSHQVLQRVRGVQRFRDSKAFASDNPELVHVRCVGELIVTPLDQFIVQNPDDFFGSSPAHAHIQLDNLEILVNHLKCAAFELSG